MACDTITLTAPAPPTPTLAVQSVQAALSDPNDGGPAFGVTVWVTVTGTGTGTLKIQYGTIYSDTFSGVVAGNHLFIGALPAGTHNICATLSGVSL